MKNNLITALVISMFITVSHARAGSDASSIMRVGDIHGTVNICGTGGKPDVLVYIPGRSFMARTDDQGEFRLNFVPMGSYQLLFEQTGTPLGQANNIAVQSNRVTELGSVNVCSSCPANYDPVCGVDGKTYSNACEAQHAGVQIASTGACG